MTSKQHQEDNVSSSLQHQPIHHHPSYRCYLRTPDMRSKIHTVSTDQSVLLLKQQVKQLLALQNVTSSSDIKLVVNEVELTDEMNLAEHLFNNAIIHVLSPPSHSQQYSSAQISIKIKQPPVNCPSLVIEKVRLDSSVKQLKSTIIEFYQSQHQCSEIAQLNQNQLYLVYAGRILIDDKILSDYNIDSNGVVYVVNAKVYMREVTRQQAERRIQQVKNQNANIHTQSITQQEEPQSSNQIGQNFIFNIIQNIVHDEDSDVEGEAANDLARSQKIIQRYDSISKKNTFTNKDRFVLDAQEADQTHFVDQEDEFLQQASQNQSLLNHNKKIPSSLNEPNSLSEEERNIVTQYLNEVNEKIITSEALDENSVSNGFHVEDNHIESNGVQQSNEEKYDEMLL